MKYSRKQNFYEEAAAVQKGEVRSNLALKLCGL